MRNNALRQGARSGRQGALGEMFAGMENRNISLDNLAGINKNYSELATERDQYNNALTGYQGNLNSLQKVNDAKIKQIAIEKSQYETKQRAEQQRQATVRMNQERAQEAQRLQTLKISKDALLGRWNQLMSRKAESDKYYAPKPGVNSGWSQAMYDQIHNHAYPGAGRGSHIITPIDLNNQQNALANEAIKSGFNPYKDLPGYK